MTDRSVILDLHVGLADGTRIDIEMQAEAREEEIEHLVDGALGASSLEEVFSSTKR